MTKGFSHRVGGDGLDRLGTVASAACAVHCAICALAPGLLAAFGLTALIGHEAEWGFTAAAVIIAVWAMIVGWRRHRTRRVVFALATGIAGLIIARGFEHIDAHWMGVTLGVVGSLGLITGHFLNMQAWRRTRTERAPL